MIHAGLWFQQSSRYWKTAVGRISFSLKNKSHKDSFGRCLMAYLRNKSMWLWRGCCRWCVTAVRRRLLQSEHLFVFKIQIYPTTSHASRSSWNKRCLSCFFQNVDPPCRLEAIWYHDGSETTRNITTESAMRRDQLLNMDFLWLPCC